MNTLQHLAAYNQWANEQVLQTLEKYGTSVPAQSLHLFSHLMNAQAIWLSRIEYITPTMSPFDQNNLADCRELHATTSGQLLELANRTAEALTEIITYRNTKGEPFATSLQDILMHVFNHGTYHRGQIARDLRQHGLEPVATDYILYVQEQKQVLH